VRRKRTTKIIQSEIDYIKSCKPYLTINCDVDGLVEADNKIAALEVELEDRDIVERREDAAYGFFLDQPAF
jgi:hypothetical protein